MIQDRSKHPDLSVVIPVYRGEMTLGITLDALFSDPDLKSEVIVVLDGPDAACRKIAAGYPVRLLELPRRSGSAAARNAGAEKATGDILLFIDADVEVLSTTLDRVCRIMLDEKGPDVIIGAYSPTVPDDGFFSRYKNLHHHYGHFSGGPTTETFWTGCGAIRRNLFFEMNGFETSSFVRNIADIEFGYRLLQRGIAVHIHPDIQVQHHKRYTFLSLIQSDLFERAIPWTRIMWRHRVFKSGLNTRRYQQLSTLLLLLVFVLWFVPGGNQLLAGAIAGCLALFVYLNRKWTQFCYRHEGALFAVRSSIMEAVYYMVCGTGVTLGTLIHLKDRFFNGTSFANHR